MSDEQIERIETRLDELFRLARDQAISSAALAVTVARIEERMAARNSLYAELKTKVDELETTKAEVKATWHVFTTIAAAFAAFLSLLLHFLRKSSLP